MEVTPLTIELDLGHTDNKKVRHTKVTFGKRITGKKLFEIDGDAQASIPTQYQDLILRAAITEFGTLKMPVPLKVLLDLDSLDREDLSTGFNRFSTESLGGRQAEQLADNKLRLAIGYESNGLTYDLVEFGTRLTGMAEVEADRLRLSDVKRRCFLAGKQVVRFGQSDGESVLDGPMPLETFEQLDSADLYSIVLGAEVWRNSFRRPGARVSAERLSEKRHAANENASSAGK
jgi:hypothetical protein